VRERERESWSWRRDVQLKALLPDRIARVSDDLGLELLLAELEGQHGVQDRWALAPLSRGGVGDVAATVNYTHQKGGRGERGLVSQREPRRESKR